jgi:hypothetical protein
LHADIAMRHQVFREISLDEGRERDRVHGCCGERR